MTKYMKYPTLFDLRDAVAADSDANPQAKLAIIDSLESLFASLGDALAWNYGWRTSELAQRHIAFEFDGISEAAQNLLLVTLLLQEFTSRIAQGISNQPMDLIVFADEARRLVSGDMASLGIADAMGVVRGCGIGLALATQTSTGVDPSVFSNAAFKLIGRCGSANDYDAISEAIGLTSEQRRWLPLNLRPGLFVGALGMGDWLRPFLFRVPLLRLSSRQPVEDDYLGDLPLLPTTAS